MIYDFFKFDRAKNTISFKENLVIDMSKVPDSAKATFFSGITTDFEGYNTQFHVNDSKTPFDLKITALSPTGLVKAIMENRLEVEGMVVSNTIQEAYIYLKDIDSLH